MKNQDEQLVAQCLAGDRLAMESLYALQGGRVKGYLLRSGFSSADADDLTQEVFLRVFRSLQTFDSSRGNLCGWVGTIARNVARKHWQRRQQPDSFDPQLADEMFSDGQVVSQSVQQQEEFDALGDCIGRLEEELAGLIRLRYVEGLTTRGMARQLNMAESTVRLRLAEAQAQLTRCMKQKGFLA